MNIQNFHVHKESYPLKLEDSFVERAEKERLRILAIAICTISVVINLALCILGIVFATMRHSPATFAFAADCGLDFFSSVVVVWRYFGSPYSVYSSSKENMACVILGSLFAFTGLGVIIEGTLFIAWKEKPTWFTVLIVLAAVGCAACITLGALKYLLYKKLGSKSMFLDAINSALSGAFAITVIVGDLAYLKDKRIWYLDPLISIVLSIILIVYGIYIIAGYIKEVRHVQTITD